MRTLLIACLLAVVHPCLAGKPNAIVYLGEMTPSRVRKDWMGQSAASVIGKGSVSEFVIAKSMCSAPHRLLTDRTERWFKEELLLQDPEFKRPPNYFFDAILLMDDGRRFRIRIDRTWVCLTSPKGSGYFFTGKGKLLGRPGTLPELTAEEATAKELADRFLEKSNLGYAVRFDRVTSRDADWMVWYDKLDATEDPGYQIVRVNKKTKKCRWGGAK